MFDPHYHQAVMQVEEEGFESNQIVEELQKGYLLKDKVLRPAMVKVNA
ncbi:nucleotide exchange factor GrpE [Sinobaca sp. H24]|nr:nucleotide exchange factor GrpE [Sinobaca sp. H24]